VNSALCEDELKHIDQWAADNNLGAYASIKLKWSKSCFMPQLAIVLKTNNYHHCPEFNTLAGSKFLTLLSVIICQWLDMFLHCWTRARTLYSLRVLRAHGLHQDCLDKVFCCTVLAKLLYASPVWSGLQQISANLTGSSTYVENCTVAKTFLNYLVWLISLCCFRLCEQTVNTSSIAFYRLNQHNLTIFVLAVTVFPYSKKSSYDDCNFVTHLLFYDIY